jgi:hypothetical protein
MRPLSIDIARCTGDENGICAVRNSCMRYLTIPLDEDQGRYTYSFFNPKDCKHKIEVEDEKTN